MLINEKCEMNFEVLIVFFYVFSFYVYLVSYVSIDLEFISVFKVSIINIIFMGNIRFFNF